MCSIVKCCFSEFVPGHVTNTIISSRNVYILFLRKLVFIDLAIRLVGSIPGNGVVRAGLNDRIYICRY